MPPMMPLSVLPNHPSRGMREVNGVRNALPRRPASGGIAHPLPAPVGIAPISVPMVASQMAGDQTTEITPPDSTLPPPPPPPSTPPLPPPTPPGAPPREIGDSVPNMPPIGVPLTPPPAPPTTTSNGSVTLTPTDPNNPLTNQTISVGPTADRFRIAQDRYDAAVRADDPRYAADLRHAGQRAFGAGRGVSGMLRTSLGDAAAERDARLNNQRVGFLSDALQNSIEDAYRNVGIAERQQLFQSGQQNTAFDQEQRRLQVQEALRNGDFQRAMQLLVAGSGGNPSGSAGDLASFYADLANRAGGAAGSLWNSVGQGGGTGNDILRWWQLYNQGTSGDNRTNDNSLP